MDGRQTGCAKSIRVTIFFDDLRLKLGMPMREAIHLAVDLPGYFCSGSVHQAKVPDAFIRLRLRRRGETAAVQDQQRCSDQHQSIDRICRGGISAMSRPLKSYFDSQVNSSRRRAILPR